MISELGKYIEVGGIANYYVLKSAAKIEFNGLSGKDTVDGPAEYRTECGKGLNPLDSNDLEFEIVSSGVCIRREGA